MRHYRCSTQSTVFLCPFRRRARSDNQTHLTKHESSPANGAVKTPRHLVTATFLRGDVKRGAFRARKYDINGRSAEHHTSGRLIRIWREWALQRPLVARSVGIVSAVLRASVSSVGSRTDGSCADAYRHSTAYGCATVSTAVCAAVIDTSAANTNAPTAICERIS